MTKPWLPLTPEAASVPGGQMGVYQLGDAHGSVLRIGYAGGRSRFGLGGELRDAVGTADTFRYEVTSAYMSRYLELMMVHLHDFGRLPERNDEDPARLGRLSPA